MLFSTQARASARALLTACPAGIAVGAAVGFALGGAYLASGLGADAANHAKAQGLAPSTSGEFSEATLRRMAEQDPGVLAIALRYNPAFLPAYVSNERQVMELASQLGRRTGVAGEVFLRATISNADNPAARPWAASALDKARQLDCLTQAVYYEARGETPSGQAAVAQVVLNRVRHPAFPKSVCAVVYQGAQTGRSCQFSFACNGSMRARREDVAWSRSEKVANRALSGYVMADVGNATHFHVTSVRPGWGPSLMQVGQIGMHVFYRFSGRPGAPGAFIAEPEAEPVRPEAPKSILASLAVLPSEAEPIASALVDAFVRVEPSAAVAAPAAPLGKTEGSDRPVAMKDGGQPKPVSAS